MSALTRPPAGGPSSPVPPTAAPAPAAAPPTEEAYLHEGSETVRFVLHLPEGPVDASISRQALRHRFGAGEHPTDLVPTYHAHQAVIQAAVVHRLRQGAHAPVMLREADFPLPARGR